MAALLLVEGELIVSTPRTRGKLKTDHLQSNPVRDEVIPEVKKPKLSPWDVAYALNMAMACFITYWIMTHALSRFANGSAHFCFMSFLGNRCHDQTKSQALVYVIASVRGLRSRKCRR